MDTLSGMLLGAGRTKQPSLLTVRSLTVRGECVGGRKEERGRERERETEGGREGGRDGGRENVVDMLEADEKFLNL